MSEKVLLDTHTLIWVVLGGALKAEATHAIAAAFAERRLHLSAATAWELGAISRKPSLKPLIVPSPRDWFMTAATAIKANLISMDADLMLGVAELPDLAHRDPADRMLIATARAHDLILVTRDRAILDYAALGHVRAMAC